MLKELLQQDESETLAYKASFGREAMEVLAAFANSQGGVILLGVDDTGSLAGLDSSRTWEEWIANISRHNIVPPLVSKYSEVVISGKRIVLKSKKANVFLWALLILKKFTVSCWLTPVSTATMPLVDPAYASCYTGIALSLSARVDYPIRLPLKNSGRGSPMP